MNRCWYDKTTELNISKYGTLIYLSPIDVEEAIRTSQSKVYHTRGEIDIIKTDQTKHLDELCITPDQCNEYLNST